MCSWRPYRNRQVLRTLTCIALCCCRRRSPARPTVPTDYSCNSRRPRWTRWNRSCGGFYGSERSCLSDRKNTKTILRSECRQQRTYPYRIDYFGSPLNADVINTSSTKVVLFLRANRLNKIFFKLSQKVPFYKIIKKILEKKNTCFWWVVIIKFALNGFLK